LRAPGDLDDIEDKCTCADLKAVRAMVTKGHDALTKRLAAERYKSRAELFTQLQKDGCTIVGKYLQGPVGAGKQLSQGEQEIIKLVENVKWNARNPAANMHPTEAKEDNAGFATQWATEEKRRLEWVISKIDEELKRRNCP
jgi:hypothetical protein